MQQNRAVCGIRRYTEADAGNALRSARHQDKNLPAESADISRCQEISAKRDEAGRKTAAAVCGAEL